VMERSPSPEAEAKRSLTNIKGTKIDDPMRGELKRSEGKGGKENGKSGRWREG